jgi:hypothetical protein
MPNNCHCDQMGLGDPTQTCGDCPEDYKRARVFSPGSAIEQEVQMLRELLADADHALAELGACDIPDCDDPNCLKVRQRIAAIAP